MALMLDWWEGEGMERWGYWEGAILKLSISLKDIQFIYFSFNQYWSFIFFL